MKRFFLLFWLLPLFAIAAAAQTGVLATFTPDKPKIRDEVKVTYNAAYKSAALRGAKEVTCEALVMREGDTPLLLEVPMKLKFNTWSCTVTLKDPWATFVLYRFVSGEKAEDNGGDCWYSYVYGPDDKPVQGAHLAAYNLHRQGGFMDFKHAKDTAKAAEEMAAERKMYPKNLAAVTAGWSAKLRDNPGDMSKIEIKKELDVLYEANKSNDDALSQLVRWFDQTDQKLRGEEARKNALAMFPKGKTAKNLRQNEIYMERDGMKRIPLIEKFLADFPQKESDAKNLKSMIIGAYIQANEYDKAAAMLDGEAKPDGNMYNSLAWPLIEKGENLEKAVAWARKGIDAIRRETVRDKMSYMSEQQWRKNRDYSLGMILDTYATGLLKQNKAKEAEKPFAEAFKLMEAENADVNGRYVECLVKGGNAKKAMQVAADCIRKSKTDDNLLQQFKKAYVKVKGSEEGFDAAVLAERNFAKEEMRRKLIKERLDKPSIDFTLKGLDGKNVHLADLKGKVVVIDFWATWCGPCKASFPSLQKVYDAYKTNDKVRIYALDCWENEKGDKREELVKKFIADNKYTFPVLYDEGFVDKYGVNGIPTKFVIDTQGRIQFQTIGFGGAQEMIDELTAQIELLLSNEFSSAK